MDKEKKVNDKKEYLQLYGVLQLSVRTIKQLIEMLKEEKAKNIEFMESCNRTNHVKKYMNEEVLKNLEHILEKKIKLCGSVFETINKLEDETEKNILIMKYIYCLTWEEISEIANYTTRQLHNIHNKALEKITI